MTLRYFGLEQCVTDGSHLAECLIYGRFWLDGLSFVTNHARKRSMKSQAFGLKLVY